MSVLQLVPEMGAANRGRSLENLIEMSNIEYRKLGKALIHKVPSKWVPIRSKEGRIVSAKIQEKASVDFIGRYKDCPIAFDAKSVARDMRWYMKGLDEHQFQFLKDWKSTQAKSGVLLGFWSIEQFYFLPFDYLSKKHAEWKNGGKASLHAEQLEKDLLPIPITSWGIDYLSVL